LDAEATVRKLLYFLLAVGGAAVPEVIRIYTADWNLSVWTKNISVPAERLASTLEARGKELPAGAVRLFPALKVSGVSPEPINSIDEKISELSIPEPVFFENRLYEFEFQFSGSSSAACPEIIHWRTDVVDAFHSSGNSLRGSINFGNDVGWFRLGLKFSNGQRETAQFLSFEVLPTKMDLAGDFAQIHRDIDSTYPLWRFSFAQKTEHELAKSRKPHERFPLLWLALFRSLRAELQEAVKLICRSPHARLLPQEKFLRPDRLKGRLTQRLEEQVTEQCRNGETHRRHRVATRRLSVDTPENRFVKMVITRCVKELSLFSHRARLNNAVPDREKLSQAFFDELESWQKPLEQRLAEPLFREVSSFNGLSGESLVLHHRAGYAKVYRVWQELKQYLDLFGRQAAISMKSVSELYEVWCLLEMRRMLIGLDFVEVESRKAALRTNGLEKDLVDGMGTAFRFTRRDGLKIRLAHEPPFSVTSKLDARGIYSWTTPQKPDILLEASFPDNSRIRWIFDAKYRIAVEDGNDDLIPDDAINQMHRYRDALIHLSAGEDGVTEKSRPIVGAFVLYPGWFKEEAGTNPYAAAVESVGIGGFPLLPGRDNLWLKEFLLAKFGTSAVRTPDACEHLLHESVRIPPTGLQLEQYSDLTLAASLGSTAGRDRGYANRFLEGVAGWYHLPASTQEKRKIPRSVMREVHFCAVAVHQPGTHDRFIDYLYDVKSVRLAKRCDLTIEQAGSIDPSNKNEYWLFELGPARQLLCPIRIGGVRSFRFRLTSASGLLSGKLWEQLEVRYPGVCGTE